MTDSWDAVRYVSYMRSRWRPVAASCAIAAAMALAVTLIQPREYTATARLVIEPPAGMDPRSAIAVSPIYLESLKTYEHFATSDSLFNKAVGQFDLRSVAGAGPVESLKRRVLRVETVRNTRILEIAATLPDARKAQALARFLAESTVELNRSVATQSGLDLLQGLERQAGEIRAGLGEAEARWAQLVASEPVDGLQASMEETAELRRSIREQVFSAELESADPAGQANARLEQMRKQIETLDHQYAEQEKLLALRLAHRDRLEAERKSAQAALVSIETRLREARGDAGYRGERLEIVDPGIVPERPSSPSLPLNLAAAVLLGLVLSVLYLTLEMSYREQRPAGDE
jgi:uncharacterized protein involved in exopolysaccharide biosynthesis